MTPITNYHLPYFIATPKTTRTLLIAELLAFVPAAIGLLPSPI